MALRTMSVTVLITVYFILICNINIMIAQITTIPNDTETLVNTENPQISTSTHGAETSLSPALDVTNTNFSTTSTTMFKASEPVSSSTAAATTLDVSRSSNLNVSSTLASPPSSTLPSTGSSNQTYSTTMSGVTQSISTMLSTQMIPTQKNGTEKTSDGTATTMSGVTLVSTTPSTQMKPTQGSGNETTNGTATTTLSDTEEYNMKYSEIILTSIFSTVLVVVVVVIIFVGFKKCLRGRSQYSHHPLRETSYEPDRYSSPDDTLVISGGLYDAPRIYNPNMTVLEEEESQNDYASFQSRPGQFKLEFLPGDKDMDPTNNGSQGRNV
ncbi:uncharacterized protein [Pyxicephalus adspersus]|uniref:uncharacterized protein n=1 Tax=Pyxicephalus adspersus TaxID=30357 RepID=UPI003B5B5860